MRAQGEMKEFVLYAKIDDQWVDAARYADGEGFLGAIERYFAMKRGEGKAMDDCDRVLALLQAPCVVARNKIGLCKRALRHFDEIGYCNELVEALDEAKSAGAAAVGWGTSDLDSIAPHDFGDMQI